MQNFFHGIYSQFSGVIYLLCFFIHQKVFSRFNLWKHFCCRRNLFSLIFVVSNLNLQIKFQMIQKYFSHSRVKPLSHKRSKQITPTTQQFLGTGLEIIWCHLSAHFMSCSFFHFQQFSAEPVASPAQGGGKKTSPTSWCASELRDAILLVLVWFFTFRGNSERKIASSHGQGGKLIWKKSTRSFFGVVGGENPRIESVASLIGDVKINFYGGFDWNYGFMFHFTMNTLLIYYNYCA